MQNLWVAFFLLLAGAKWTNCQMVNSLLNHIKLDLFKRASLAVSAVLAPLAVSASVRTRSSLIEMEELSYEVSNLIVCCGYLIEPFQYRPYASCLRHRRLREVTSPSINGSSVLEDAEAIMHMAQTMLEDSTPAPNQPTDRLTSLCLIGHSRGAAAATAAFSALTRSSLGQRLRLVLLDPVDTVDSEVLHVLTSASRAPRPSRLASADHRALIVSTPYGGLSRYYKTAYASACAPGGRNADSFFAALRPAVSSVSMVTLPQFGHLQFLAARGASRFADTCASGEFQDAELVEYTQTLLQAWLAVGSDDELLDLQSRLAAHFPELEQRWS